MKLLPLLLFTTILLANKEPNVNQDFLNSLEEVSKIATKTKLNIDDSPSFVTILRNDKLQKLGIDNVYEALAQVPGVQLSREASGAPVVIFRGVSQKSEVKLMVDGVTINNNYRGSIYYYLDFPIELVERIEVIRGAGSVLHGSGAMSGVINIITKSASDAGRDSVFISGATDDYKGGAIVSTHIDEIKVALDAYNQTSKKNIDSTDRHLNDYSVGLKINNANFALLARIKNSDEGNAYGVLGIPDRQKNKYYNKNESIYTQLSFKHSLGEKSSIETAAGFNRYSQDVQAALSVTTPATAIFREESYYAEADVHSTLIPSNELLFGIKFENAQAKYSEFRVAGVLNSPIAHPNSQRETFSAYFNDKYSLSPVFDISAGFRFDEYSDFGSALSPTVGLIYRLGENIKLKALYAKAYRAPSWVELTSNKSLQAEESKSFEAGIIYKNNKDTVLRFNIYKTKITNLITQDTTRKYIQYQNSDYLGTELEYIFTPTNELEINLFGSYLHEESKAGADIANIADYLITASLLYEFDFGLSLGSLVKYIPDIERSRTDSRASAPSSLIFDQTFSYRFRDITANLVIKDLFNHGTYYPLPISTKYNDFYDGGRSILVKAKWEF